jgi:hypothetical protein
MPKTLDDYAQSFRDPRNLNVLKQFPLTTGGGLACGKGDEPNTTIAFLADNTGQGIMAVENGAGFEAREVAPAPRAQAEVNALGLKSIKLCQKLVP